MKKTDSYQDDKNHSAMKDEGNSHDLSENFINEESPLLSMLE